MSRKNYYLKVLLLTLITQFAFAQGQGNNPYSVLGLGEEAGQTNAAQDMMGGTGVSFGNGFYVNTLNPAMMMKNRASGQLKYVSFNVGLKGNYRTISQGNVTQLDYGLNMNDLSLSFPLNNKWAMGFTLNPYTIVDYNNKIVKSITGNSTENIVYENKHSGGITRVGYVNSIRLLKSLYIGLSGYYNFGVINKDSTSYFENAESSQLRRSTKYNTKGVNGRLGIAYQQKISQNWQINIGGMYEKSANLKTSTLRTFANYLDNGNGAVLAGIPDTLSYVNSTFTTPDQYRIGVSLESPFHWVFAADYGITKWSTHKSADTWAQKYYTDSKELALGIEWLPKSTSTKFYNQVFYRVGFNSTKTPYVISGKQILDNKFSLGLSVPMGFRNPSYVNIGAAFGRRGTILDNQIRENYVRMSISISLLSPWFIKPKID